MTLYDLWPVYHELGRPGEESHSLYGMEEDKERFMLVFTSLNFLAIRQFDAHMPFISLAGSIGLTPPHTNQEVNAGLYQLATAQSS